MVESVVPILTHWPGTPSKRTIAILFGVVIETTWLWPIAIRDMTSTSATVWGDGGIKKSALLVPLPSGVITVMRPDPAAAGTVVVMLVAVAAVMAPKV